MTRIDMPDHPKGRYLCQPEPKGRWWLYESDGTPARQLNEYENRFVCAAHVPMAEVNAARARAGGYINTMLDATKKADHFAARCLELAQENERQAARIAELQTALMSRRFPRLREIIRRAINRFIKARLG